MDDYEVHDPYMIFAIAAFEPALIASVSFSYAADSASSAIVLAFKALTLDYAASTFAFAALAAVIT